MKKGDTLYRIALDHGQSYSDLVAWNNLANPNDIKVDQVLRVAPLPPGSVAPASTQPIVIGGGNIEVKPLPTPPSTAMSPTQVRTLPVHVVRELNQILRAKYYLEAQHQDGKDARAEDIAHLVERSVEEVQDILALSEHPVSLDAPMDNDPQASLMEMLPGDPQAEPESSRSRAPRIPN